MSHAQPIAPAAAPASPPFTEDVRHRLVAATLGAHGREMLTVRAGDLRALIARTDDVERALEVLGENAALKEQLARARAQAATVPILTERITALEAQLHEVKERAWIAAKILTGKQA